jgi:Sec-independent protein translocase protein TatA
MLGPQDLIALALGIFFFGAKKPPELSRSLGQAMSEFKKGVASGAQNDAAPAATPAKTEATQDGAKTDAAKTDGAPSH